MKKIILIVIILVLLIVFAIGFVVASKPDKLTEAEKKEAVEKIVGRKANLDPEIKTGSGTYKGKYVDFSYPAVAEEYKYRSENIKENKSILESFSFDIKNPRLILNFTVIDTQVKNFDEIPSLRLRESTSSGYAKAEEKTAGIVGVSYKKERNGEFMAEKSSFFLKDGKLFTFSVTGTSLEDIEKIHKQIIESVVFK